MATKGKGTIHRQTFDSMAELLGKIDPDDVRQYVNQGHKFTHVESASEALDLARNGWSDEMSATLSVADDAIAKVQTEHTLLTFVPTFDVQGCDVDLGRYLSGEPECMVDYPLTPIVKAGRVITVCASMSISGAVSTVAMIRRGQAVTALALALSKLGYALEVWVDLTGKPMGGNGKTSVTRVLVKSAHDVTDPERLLFALAHPAMLRVFGFAALMLFGNETGCNSTWQTPQDPIQDLPAGTIYLPRVMSSSDVPDADKALTDYLRQLEIITD